MTKKEAIDLLDNLIGFIEDNHGSDYDKALKMAIGVFRNIEEIREVMSCDADAETKCKMISNILTAKPHYFEDQEPKTIEEKQAESQKYQKAFDDGYENGYAQARFDYEQEPITYSVSKNDVIKMLNTMDRYVADKLRLCDTNKEFPSNEIFIVDDVYEGLDLLPPVTPTRPTCKDCKWKSRDIDFRNLKCPWGERVDITDNDFCSRYERR